MTGESLVQARHSLARLSKLANDLAGGGLFAAAEIVAGGAMVLGTFLAELAPEPRPALAVVPDVEKAG